MGGLDWAPLPATKPREIAETLLLTQEGKALLSGALKQGPDINLSDFHIAPLSSAESETAAIDGGEAGRRHFAISELRLSHSDQIQRLRPQCPARCGRYEVRATSE